MRFDFCISCGIYSRIHMLDEETLFVKLNVSILCKLEMVYFQNLVNH